jgi:hypothetical protein
MTIEDLFPERKGHQFKPERRPFAAADVLRAITFEAGIVLVAARDVAEGRVLTADDHARLLVAANRISAAIEAGGLAP